MPQIVDYRSVAQRLTAQGLVSLYHNSGAFGFAPEATIHTVGWMGSVDPTIRQEMRPLVRQVGREGEPYHLTLSMMLVGAWEKHLAGEMWLMPKSHWHYELHFGNREMLERILPRIGVEPNELRDRNDGSAIAFLPEELPAFGMVVQPLVSELRYSDFLLAFPGRAVGGAGGAALCTVHHHGQLWWQTSDSVLAGELRTL